MKSTFFAQNIKLLRKRRKRTQDEVAAALEHEALYLKRI